LNPCNNNTVDITKEKRLKDNKRGQGLLLTI